MIDKLNLFLNSIINNLKSKRDQLTNYVQQNYKPNLNQFSSEEVKNNEFNFELFFRKVIFENQVCGFFR